MAQSGVKLSRIHSNVEFYDFNEKEEGLYWVNNAKMDLSKRDFLNIEIIGVYHSNSGEQFFTPGDFNITYSRKFYSPIKSTQKWRGITSSVKLVLPTGQPGNAGLFGHWILEPAIQYSWVLSNERFTFSNKWRYNFPLANTGNWSEPPIFLRFDPQLSYNANQWTASVSLDNRMVFNRDAFVIFTRLDAGYRFNDQFGVYTFYTRRVRETTLFKTYAGVGFYYNF